MVSRSARQASRARLGATRCYLGRTTAAAPTSLHQASPSSRRRPRRPTPLPPATAPHRRRRWRRALQRYCGRKTPAQRQPMRSSLRCCAWQSATPSTASAPARRVAPAPLARPRATSTSRRSPTRRCSRWKAKTRRRRRRRCRMRWTRRTASSRSLPRAAARGGRAQGSASHSTAVRGATSRASLRSPRQGIAPMSPIPPNARMTRSPSSVPERTPRSGRRAPRKQSARAAARRTRRSSCQRNSHTRRSTRLGSGRATASPRSSTGRPRCSSSAPPSAPRTSPSRSEPSTLTMRSGHRCRAASARARSSRWSARRRARWSGSALVCRTGSHTPSRRWAAATRRAPCSSLPEVAQSASRMCGLARPCSPPPGTSRWSAGCMPSPSFRGSTSRSQPPAV
mmetsp:Transcript_17551/g.55896  ORF Transcript_17551/g.55896 Transcript_17551/m.55896 type:complete len:397 (-) Transcript_17551:756-1946(-)